MKKLSFYLSILLLVALLNACKNSQNKKDLNPTLIITDAQKAETYQKIIKNDARLYAMLSGKFMQYLTKKGEYTPWLVGEEQDSILLCVIPIGDPNKNGHWLYHYQYMTDLPDAPLMTAFSKLKTIDRDTILQVFYEVPKGFNPPISQILKTKEAVFEEITYDSSKLSLIDETATYWRVKPLLFEGESSFVAVEKQTEAVSYVKDYFKITPERNITKRRFYNQAKTSFIPHGPDKFEKIANIEGFNYSNQ